MASVLAIISRAVFDRLPVWWPGQVAALDRYRSANAALDQLGPGDALFLVTVRPGDELWLVADIRAPRRARGAWVGEVNRTPITDITKLVRRLVLASGEGIKARRGKLGMSLQTPRVLAPGDVALLRGAVPRGKRAAAAAAPIAMAVTKPARRARAAPDAAPPNVGGPVPAAARALVERVYAAPDDRGLRAVVADALLEHRHVWGELISLQLHDARRHARRIAEIIKKHAADFVGPIAHLARRDGMDFEDGFLVACLVSKLPAWRGVGRKQWDAAARAPQWATVKRVQLVPYVTPHWWIEQWIANPATAGLELIRIGNVKLERATRDAPWQLTMARGQTSGTGHVITLLKSLPAAELARIPTPSSPTARVTLDKVRGARR